MSTSRTARLLAAATTAVAALALAGCTGSAGSSQAGGLPSTPATTAPSTPATTSAPTAPAGGTTTTAPSSTPSAAPSTAPGGGSASASPTPLRSTRCTAAVLSASLAPGDGGAAGSMLPYLVLTNTGSQRCTLQGWPGVSFVGGGNGTQIGAAGVLDRSSAHGTVTLDPGKSAHAPLRIAQAANYPQSTCQPVTADGLRVYAPGETHALFVATTDLTACRSTGVQLITVQALLPGA